MGEVEVGVGRGGEVCQVGAQGSQCYQIYLDPQVSSGTEGSPAELPGVAYTACKYLGQPFVVLTNSSLEDIRGKNVMS